MKFGLSSKLVLMVFTICTLLISVGVFSYISLSSISSQYRDISFIQFPKVEITGRLIAAFRQIRIAVRTLAVEGADEEIRTKYLQQTRQAINGFVDVLEVFNNLPFAQDEFVHVKEINDLWQDFHEFGGQLLYLYSNPTTNNLREASELILNICPVKADAWVERASAFIDLQSKQTQRHVASAAEKQGLVSKVTMALASLAAILSISFGYFYARKISKSIANVAAVLESNSSLVRLTSQDILKQSQMLSEAATESAASLQQTVASIDQISSMIERNSNAAISSTKVSNQSREAANRGKVTVDSMISSINEISNSNEDIAKVMKQNGTNMSQIVHVISEIGEKTKVINDIVFQTKLLSFNASVEAARAGEHGKGFTVVAEEVGNLAALSGNASMQISQMLESSIKQVMELVESTNEQVEIQVKAAKDKVLNGISTAKECGNGLNEILHNVTSVNELVSEIASASSEQSTGVREVTTVMQQLDQATHQNTFVAQESAAIAKRLNEQASELNRAVSDLIALVDGKGELVA